MRPKPKGFGPEPEFSDKLDKALNKLTAQLSADCMDESTQPSERGQVDAFLGNPCNSSDPSYREAYRQVKSKKTRLSPEEEKIFNGLISQYKNFFSAIDVAGHED